MPIESKMISKSVESAQRKVESRNFAIRKNVLNYDDVMNMQREVIYKQRREVLDGDNLKDNVLKMITSTTQETVNNYIEEDGINKEAFMQEVTSIFGITHLDTLGKEKISTPDVVKELQEKAIAIYEQKEQEFGEEPLRELERVVTLKIVDQKWMDHIDDMDELKNGIGLRAYGQKDPVVQYRLEGMDMFEAMTESIKVDVVKFLLNARKREQAVQREQTMQVTNASLEDTAINLVDGGYKKDEGGMNKTVVNQGPKVGRNDPCPCGSGKKYKNCCGKNASYPGLQETLQIDTNAKNMLLSPICRQTK